MSRYVDLPARGHLSPVSLLARISTPLNRSATTLSPNHPTILLCHPNWTDSFFFYPQYDEPALYENYNLITFDIRGHGDTLIEPLESGTFTWWDAADDAYLALRELGVDSVHLLGASLSSHTALRMASQHPEFVVSATLISPASSTDPEGWAEIFEECKQLIFTALTENDHDIIDDLILSAWSVGLGATPVVGPIQDIRQRLVGLSQTKLADGRLHVAVPYLKGLLDSRCTMLSNSELEAITCPVLAVIGPEEAEQGLVTEYNEIARVINKPKLQRLGISRSASTPQATVVTMDGVPRWMSLASAHLLHPIWLEHLEAAYLQQVESEPPSPLSSTFDRSARTSLSSLSSGRRRSSPKEMTGFNIPPPPRLGPGVMTLGQAMERDGAGITVEVMVTVDEAAEGRSVAL